MPIYEYNCKKCGNTFEQLVFPSDDADRFTCPSCGDGDTCRLMSSFSCGSSKGGGDLSSDLSTACSASSGGFS